MAIRYMSTVDAIVADPKAGEDAAKALSAFIHGLYELEEVRHETLNFAAELLDLQQVAVVRYVKRKNANPAIGAQQSFNLQMNTELLCFKEF